MTASPSSPNAPPDQSAVTRMVARERVHAMESLAGVIAHELRASVLGVTSAAQILRFSVPQDPIVEKSLGRILQEAERLNSLHESLTEYSTELPPRLVPGEPDEVWRATLTSMRGPLEAKSVMLTHASATSGTRCVVDSEQLGRAFERVVHHALDHVLAGAEIDVVSSTDGGWWTSSLSVSDATFLSPAPDFERPTFFLTLAHRTLVAHGGYVVEDSGDDPSLLASIRLPLSAE